MLEMNFITKPIPPINIVPKKVIFRESQNSFFAGFLDIFSSLEVD